MFKPAPVSAYLAKPSLARQHQFPSWKILRTQFYWIKRHNPRLFEQSLVLLFIWCAVVGIIQSTVKPATANLSAATSQTNPAASPAKLAGIASAPSALPNLPSSTVVKALPGGPTGQLLPPGTMAPDRTYANSYAWGQCTWYVAGRRQVPPNWGNANSWYYHAVGSGWSVGTVPAIAAIAWTPAGYYGHVALVEKVSTDGKQVYVSEMNYHGVGVKSYRWAPASSFKYIY